MAGKSPSALSGREYAILKLLWERGPLTVREVRDELAGGRGDAGRRDPLHDGPEPVAAHGEEGVRGSTRPRARRIATRRRCPRSRTTRLVIRDFVSRFFDGSTEALLMGLAESPDVSPEIWEKLRSAIKRRQEPSDE